MKSNTGIIGKISRLFMIIVFALVMFMNIKIAILDNSEIAYGEIGLFGIEVELFEPLYAYDDASCWDMEIGCYAFGADACIFLVGPNQMCHYP